MSWPVNIKTARQHKHKIRAKQTTTQWSGGVTHTTHLANWNCLTPTQRPDRQQAQLQSEMFIPAGQTPALDCSNCWLSARPVWLGIIFTKGM